MPPAAATIDSGLAARAHLVAALHADLIGPFAPDQGTADPAGATELLRMNPSRWYLTGFLANEVLREAEDDTEEGELGSGDDLEPDTNGTAEPEPKAKRFLPASMGMTVLLRPGTTALRVRLRYADYLRMTRKQLAAIHEEPPQRKKESAQTAWWRRTPRGWVSLTLPLVGGGEHTERVPDSRGVELVTRTESVADVPGIEDGTLAVSVFVVNRRQSDTDAVRDPRRDENYLFQVELEIRSAEIVPRADRHLETSKDDDDRILDLQYRDHVEWAVGHGCATECLRESGAVVGVRSVWIPQAEVVKVEARDLAGVELRMERLAALTDPAQVHAALDTLASAYRGWIAEQAAKPIEGTGRQGIHSVLLARARTALARIEDGIALLASDPQARLAFTLANTAMASAQRKRRPDVEPKWRPFQLAFVLLNLRGIVDPTASDRETVELIFFPTGGGKTDGGSDSPRRCRRILEEGMGPRRSAADPVPRPAHADAPTAALRHSLVSRVLDARQVRRGRPRTRAHRFGQLHRTCAGQQHRGGRGAARSGVRRGRAAPVGRGSVGGLRARGRGDGGGGVAIDPRAATRGPRGHAPAGPNSAPARHSTTCAAASA